MYKLMNLTAKLMRLIYKQKFQKDINELRTLVIEDRAKSALIVGGVPTLLSLLIGALGLWTQTK